VLNVYNDVSKFTYVFAVQSSKCDSARRNWAIAISTYTTKPGYHVILRHKRSRLSFYHSIAGFRHAADKKKWLPFAMPSENAMGLGIRGGSQIMLHSTCTSVVSLGFNWHCRLMLHFWGPFHQQPFSRTLLHYYCTLEHAFISLVFPPSFFRIYWNHARGHWWMTALNLRSYRQFSPPSPPVFSWEDVKETGGGVG